MVDIGLKKLRSKYSDHVIEIIRLMLKFDEQDRPSFIELAKLVLTSTENSIDSPKTGGVPNKIQHVVGANKEQNQKSIEQQNMNRKVNKGAFNSGHNLKENQNYNQGAASDSQATYGIVQRRDSKQPNNANNNN